jgi:hypothetical protein
LEDAAPDSGKGSSQKAPEKIEEIKAVLPIHV